ncbi:MAG TPA: hypothetical protein VN688_21405 [Gemmataceae bacterium]|nr:hypothetical protein [Gemmataceae bacterium]
MGNDNINNTTPSDGIFRRRSWRLFWLVGVAGAALALLLGFLFRDWLPGSWRSDDALDDPFPAGALADYVPEDSEAMLTVNLRTLLESPVGQRMKPSLQQLVQRGERQFRWMDLLGIKPFDDLDSLQISFAPGSGGQPLWLARGRLDRSRFQIGPDKLQTKTIEHFRVWEYADRQRNQTTLLAPVGDALVVSDTPSRVLAALHQASHPRSVVIRDVTLRELLAKVDRRQSLWLAASFKQLGPVARIDNVLLEMILRPLFTHADSVHGGLTCAEDIRAELHFHTPTEESAAKLEEDLNAICGSAEGVSLFVRKELLPLLHLLSSGQTSREGKTVSLRCRLAADQFGG